MMDKIKLILIIWMVTVIVITQNNALGQENEPSALKSAEQNQNEKLIGFEDRNQDGVNDLFYDADGDGKNDLNGKAYKHHYKFSDQNKDGVNDLWIDRDGDGVNDLAAQLQAHHQNEPHMNILDYDENGRNDITGEKYEKNGNVWMGGHWGFWDESKGQIKGTFIDEDGDGMDDRLRNFDRFIQGEHQSSRMMDRFIDEDGDGICDWRTDFLNRMGNHGGDGNWDSNHNDGHKH